MVNYLAAMHTLKAQLPYKPNKVLMRSINFAALLVVAAILTSCASSGVVRNATPILTTKPVSLDFVYVETFRACLKKEKRIKHLN